MIELKYSERRTYRAAGYAGILKYQKYKTPEIYPYDKPKIPPTLPAY